MKECQDNNRSIDLAAKNLRQTKAELEKLELRLSHETESAIVTYLEALREANILVSQLLIHLEHEI